MTQPEARSRFQAFFFKADAFSSSFSRISRNPQYENRSASFPAPSERIEVDHHSHSRY